MHKHIDTKQYFIPFSTLVRGSNPGRTSSMLIVKHNAIAVYCGYDELSNLIIIMFVYDAASARKAVCGWVDVPMEWVRAIIAFLPDPKLTDIKCRNQRNDDAIWINEMGSSGISKYLLAKGKWNRLPFLSNNQRPPIFANLVSQT